MLLCHADRQLGLCRRKCVEFSQLILLLTRFTSNLCDEGSSCQSVNVSLECDDVVKRRQSHVTCQMTRNGKSQLTQKDTITPRLG